MDEEDVDYPGFDNEKVWQVGDFLTVSDTDRTLFVVELDLRNNGYGLGWKAAENKSEWQLQRQAAMRKEEYDVLPVCSLFI